jgi:hypothetical protein
MRNNLLEMLNRIWEFIWLATYLTTVVMSRPVSHIEHESGRTGTMPVTNNPSRNHTQPQSPTYNTPNNAPNHVGSTTPHTQKTNHPPSLPQHYVPLTQPAPVPKEHPAPQHQHEYSQPHANPAPQPHNPHEK